MLLQHSPVLDKNQQKMLKRVKKYYKDETKRVGISLVDVEEFFRFLDNINDVDTALTFYHMAGASIDAPTLQHVASSVAGVTIPDHVIEVVFALFDENREDFTSLKLAKVKFLRGFYRRRRVEQSRVRERYEKTFNERFGTSEGHWSDSGFGCNVALCNGKEGRTSTRPSCQVIFFTAAMEWRLAPFGTVCSLIGTDWEGFMAFSCYHHRPTLYINENFIAL